MKREREGQKQVQRKQAYKQVMSILSHAMVYSVEYDVAPHLVQPWPTSD